MGRFIHIKSFLVFVATVLLLGWVANLAFGLSYWIAVAVVAIGVLTNGLLLVLGKRERDGS